MKFVDPWHLGELYELLAQAHTMMESVNHTVNTILDFRQATVTQGNPIPHLRYMAATRSEKSGQSVIVVSSRATRAVVDTFLKFYSRFTGREMLPFVESLEEARKLLREESQG